MKKSFTRMAVIGLSVAGLWVNDNDGDGRNAMIEIVPNTFHSKDIQLAPVVRFAP